MKEWAQVLYERYLSKPLIRLCVITGTTPNQVTIYNFLMTLILGGLSFATGHYYAGLMICILNGVLDYVDGDLARATKQYSKTGEWLDSGGDVIIQNSIMAAIAYGLLVEHTGGGLSLPVAATMFYFVGNAAMNLISFHYNTTFGFNSHAGSALFRKYMDTKPHLLNRFLKNLIDPTSSHTGMIFWTIRYWLVLGILLNQMAVAFMIITSILVFRATAMYIIYALHLAEYKKLWLLQALAIIDEGRQEYYNIRMKNG